MMRFLSFSGSVCLCCVCSSPWSVCEVVLVLYVDAVVAVTVMHVLLFVLHVCMLRECEGAWVTAMLLWGMEEVWVSSAADMLWMSVVCEMRGLGRVCAMCLAWAA